MKRIFNFSLSLVCSLCMIQISCGDEEGQINASEVSADFTADATEVSTSNVVTFNDQSAGDVTHWSWIFEGGTPGKSNVQNPSVVYNQPGSFEVKLVVSNSRYTNKMVKTEYITVTEAPQPVTADFSADKLSILSGESITFTSNTKGNPDTWSWEFIPESGNTLTSSEENPTITFDHPDIYAVRLTVSNSVYSDEELKDQYITVIDATNVAADFSADTRAIYSGQQISFTDISVGTVTSWQWTFEGGTPSSSTDQHPQVTYQSAGKYKVTLEVSNDSKTSTEEQAGYITVIPGEGLVTFLPFNGNSEDKGPFGLSVANSGSVVFDGTDRNNQSGAVAVFDGVGSLLVNAATEKKLGTSSYSVGVWLKTDVPSRMMIWEEGGGGSGYAQAWFRINDNSSDQLYRLNTNTGGFVNAGTADGASALSDNMWHYVVCVRDASGSAKVYVDGVMMKENNAVTISSLDNDIGFTIGGQYNGVDNISNLYTGQLDDLVIYKRSLSEEEITFLSGL